MLKLFDYWRSSAAFRVRIALQLKGVGFETETISLHPRDRQQLSSAYRQLNPQMRLPAIELDGEVVGQSLAILEWIDETYTTGPALLPSDPVLRLKTRAFAQTIACDIHPLNNPSVLNALRDGFAASDGQISQWYSDWIIRGFTALEHRYGQERNGAFLFGDHPTIAEICLVPQMYNARRFNVALDAFPNLCAIDAHCAELSAFRAAAPEAVK